MKKVQIIALAALLVSSATFPFFGPTTGTSTGDIQMRQMADSFKNATLYQGPTSPGLSSSSSASQGIQSAQSSSAFSITLPNRQAASGK